MTEDYPYMISNNKIKPILDAIHSAAKPQKFSHEFLKQIGFSSSNDRAIIPLFKRLGLINESGSPTNYYDELKDLTKREFALGERIKDLYADIFAINQKINTASEDEVKGAMSRITGKDASTVARYYQTFKTISLLAKFENATEIKKPVVNNQNSIQEEPKEIQGINNNHIKSEFHYNIQIHLPATTDISVYNAIFKSLKENLIV
jgi:hypothetical protein